MPNAVDLTHAQRPKKSLFVAGFHSKKSVGFGFVGSHFADEARGRKSARHGQSGFADHGFPQFAGKLLHTEIFIHAAEVDIELIDAGFFKGRHPVGNDVGDPPRIVAVLIAAVIGDDGLRTKLQGFFHWHC